MIQKLPRAGIPIYYDTSLRCLMDHSQSLLLLDEYMTFYIRILFIILPKEYLIFPFVAISPINNQYFFY